MHFPGYRHAPADTVLHFQMFPVEIRYPPDTDPPPLMLKTLHRIAIAAEVKPASALFRKYTFGKISHIISAHLISPKGILMMHQGADCQVFPVQLHKIRTFYTANPFFFLHKQRPSVIPPFQILRLIQKDRSLFIQGASEHHIPLSVRPHHLGITEIIGGSCGSPGDYQLLFCKMQHIAALHHPLLLPRLLSVNRRPHTPGQIEDNLILLYHRRTGKRAAR